MRIKAIAVSLFFIMFISAYGQWNKLTPPLDDIFTDVCFYDEYTGFLTTTWDVYKTVNGGLSWTTVDIPEAKDRINDIHMLDENVIWLTSDNNPPGLHNSGSILKSIDGGNTWEVKLELNKFGFKDLFFLDDTHAWVTTDFYRVFKTDNGGETWIESEEMEMRNGSKVYFVDENTGWVCGGSARSRIYKTTDGGFSWELQFEELNFTYQGLYDIVFFNVQKGFVCGRERRFLATENGGETWEYLARDTIEGPLVGLPGEYSISGMEFKDQNRGWIIGGPC